MNNGKIGGVFFFFLLAQSFFLKASEQEAKKITNFVSFDHFVRKSKLQNILEKLTLTTKDKHGDTWFHVAARDALKARHTSQNNALSSLKKQVKEHGFDALDIPNDKRETPRTIFLNCSPESTNYLLQALLSESTKKDALNLIENGKKIKNEAQEIIYKNETLSKKKAQWVARLCLGTDGWRSPRAQIKENKKKEKELWYEYHAYSASAYCFPKEVLESLDIQEQKSMEFLAERFSETLDIATLYKEHNQDKIYTKRKNSVSCTIVQPKNVQRKRSNTSPTSSTRELEEEPVVIVNKRARAFTHSGALYSNQSPLLFQTWQEGNYLYTEV